MTRVWGALAILFVASCALRAPAEISAVSWLEDDELRAALAGNDLRSYGVVGPHERFCASGRWFMQGTRAPRNGEFSVYGDTFCVPTPSGAPHCRRLLRIAPGDFVRDVGAPPNTPPARVEITPSVVPC